MSAPSFSPQALSPARRGVGTGAVGLLLLAGLALWLLLLGRPLICACGTVRLFVADSASPETSQQIADWYSALHVVFGFGLWLWIDALKPHWQTGRKMLLVLASASLWEAIENIPFVIALFADPPGAAPYAGDSVLNALADTVFVLLGGGMARHLPLWAILILGLAMEFLVMALVSDGYVLGTLRAIGLS